MTTGLDLVREQILISDGGHLSRIQSELQQTGHSIECRIYAEVPEENFRPDTGVIAVYRPPSGPGIRLDSGVQEGSDVGLHYDPMLAKLIVWAGARDAAIERMKRALSEFCHARSSRKSNHIDVCHPNTTETRVPRRSIRHSSPEAPAGFLSRTLPDRRYPARSADCGFAGSAGNGRARDRRSAMSGLQGQSGKTGRNPMVLR